MTQSKNNKAMLKTNAFCVDARERRQRQKAAKTAIVAEQTIQKVLLRRLEFMMPLMAEEGSSPAQSNDPPQQKDGHGTAHSDQSQSD